MPCNGKGTYCMFIGVKINRVKVVLLACYTPSWPDICSDQRYYQVISNSMEVMACTRFRHQGRNVHNGESESTLEHDMPIGPYLCLYQIFSKYFKPHSQEFGLEIHSGEVIRKPLCRCCLSCTRHTYWSWPIPLPNIIKICLRVSKLWRAQDFGFGGDNYKTKKKMRVVSLACDTPTGPPLHLYQILSHDLKQKGSYCLHKTSASGKISI